jgi:hypothetical protein
VILFVRFRAPIAHVGGGVSVAGRLGVTCGHSDGSLAGRRCSEAVRLTRSEVGVRARSRLTIGRRRTSRGLSERSSRSFAFKARPGSPARSVRRAPPPAQRVVGVRVGDRAQEVTVLADVSGEVGREADGPRSRQFRRRCSAAPQPTPRGGKCRSTRPPVSCFVRRRNDHRWLAEPRVGSEAYRVIDVD